MTEASATQTGASTVTSAAQSGSGEASGSVMTTTTKRSSVGKASVDLFVGGVLALVALL